MLGGRATLLLLSPLALRLRGYMALTSALRTTPFASRRCQPSLRGSASATQGPLGPASGVPRVSAHLPSLPAPTSTSLPSTRLAPMSSAAGTPAAGTPVAAMADMASTGSGPLPVRDTVTLTPGERELFDTLLAATRHAGATTALRCAGGWVRDKLLGRDSDDIDIALDDKMGRDFAELVNDYLKAQGRESRHAAVIQSNPDQSKHLETARMKIGEVWIDLVNLRSETYAADSRIPSMTFGTPEQDALRRDFTVNALFYNISAGGVVEDLTGRGLQDLRDGLIRTPLPPLETFLDDPLRVLRAVRFATRFGFRLHPDVLEAAASEQVGGGGSSWKQWHRSR
ncbi:hypothetical protein HYH03_001120 [Edaphochlamys debaryana]|uniref:Poly A polymerase head domain-containing protein n=1 Tax=Edaphochlamys debaryana TaxID=47281 RepID=A0A836C6N3_9CHLO|nr:hypothetical protein HYH03_001120 [Edaphochlamys debaryana]|eukprot:KAG2501328.1 hypothetical protein HYH03_001120 [Edaphochlamys debaryana]